MIELGKPMPPQTAAKDVTDQTFMVEVIEASKTQPVVVDFWAPWCGPCKTLGPMLEAAVAATKGAVRMVKVNVDQNQLVAGQLRVQSIPAVFAFFQGQPVDGFMGAISGAEVKTFVQRLVDLAGGGGGIDEALDAADAMLADGAAADAAETYAAVLGEEPSNPRALGGMARAMLAAGDADRARAALDMAPAEIAGHPAIVAARAALDLAAETAKVGGVADLRARIAADPADHQARFDLSLALLAKGDNEGAVDTLLSLFAADREWNDGAAKTQLFKLFDSFGPKDPLTIKGRRRLSSMIYQ